MKRVEVYDYRMVGDAPVKYRTYCKVYINTDKVTDLTLVKRGLKNAYHTDNLSRMKISFVTKSKNVCQYSATDRRTDTKFAEVHIFYVE